jgi:hypothetical protein
MDRRCLAGEVVGSVSLKTVWSMPKTSGPQTPGSNKPGTEQPVNGVIACHASFDRWFPPVRPPTCRAQDSGRGQAPTTHVWENSNNSSFKIVFAWMIVPDPTEASLETPRPNASHSLAR